MTRILDGKQIGQQIRAEVAKAVQRLTDSGGRPPGLAAVLVGADPASQTYVHNKTRASEEAGIVGCTVELSAEVSEAALIAAIDELNGDDTVDGILVQLPLPDHLSEQMILDRVSPDKDVDGFHTLSVGRLWLDRAGLAPATPSGILELLRRSDVAFEGREAVIVGRSTIVGKPMAALLLREHCTVTVCHSRTRDLAGVCSRADLLVAAIGQPAMFGPEHVKEGAVVIDVGINRITDPAEVERLFPGDEKRRAALERRGAVLVGDVDFIRVAPKTSAITPVPGGVGPLTVAMLLANTLEASRRRQGFTESAVSP